MKFFHKNKNSIINQRELGSDTQGFATALKSALRQDPDVVLVGEMRDLETISLAITTAETGHLVLASLHTNSCVASITRIIDAFPSHQQDQVRTQLSFSLMGVMSQLLIPSLDGKRTACLENYDSKSSNKEPYTGKQDSPNILNNANWSRQFPYEDYESSSC